MVGYVQGMWNMKGQWPALQNEGITEPVTVAEADLGENSPIGPW